MAEPKISQQVLEDFMATVAKNPNVDRQQLLQVFPEFGNDMKMLDAAFDYRATRLENPNADIATVNSKFPEFFGIPEPAQAQPAAAGGVSGGSLLSDQEELARQNAIQGVTDDPYRPHVEQKQPNAFQTLYKGLGAGVINTANGLLGFLNRANSGRLAYDPVTLQQMAKQGKSPEEIEQAAQSTLARLDSAETERYNAWKAKADQLAAEAKPDGGEKSFTDYLNPQSDDFDLRKALQLGLGTAAESLPYTLSALNPVATASMIMSMSEQNYRQSLIDNPDMSDGQRLASAAGNAAIEMAVEHIGNPFKVFKAGKLTAPNATKWIKQVVKESKDNIYKGILRVLGFGAKEAGKEGGEEVITTAGQDLYNTLLDWKDTNGLGLRSQWERAKQNNPNLTPGQFALDKAKGLTNDFIGGALSGMMMSGPSTGVGIVQNAKYYSKNGGSEASRTQAQQQLAVLQQLATEFDVTEEEVAQAIVDYQAQKQLTPKQQALINRGEEIITNLQNAQSATQATELQEPVQETTPLSPAAAEHRRAVDEVTQSVRERTHGNGYIYPVAMPGNAEKTGYIVGEVVPVIDESNPEQLRIENDDVVTVKWSDGTVTQERARDLNLTGVPMMAQQAIDIEVENQMYGYTQQRIQNGEQPVLMRNGEGVLEGFFPTEGGLLEDQNGVQYTPEQLAEQGWQETKPVLFVNDQQQIAALDNGDGTYTQVDALGNPIAEPMSAEAFSEQGFAMVPLEEEQPKSQAPVIADANTGDQGMQTPVQQAPEVQQPEVQEPAASVVPNIETMSAEELGGSAVEFMGDRASAMAYLEAERDKADAEVQRTSKLKVTRFNGPEDFKRQNDQIQATKRAAIDRYNKLQNAITAANAYKTLAEQEEEAERKAREAALREKRRQLAEAETAGDIEAKWQNTKKTVGFAATKTLPNGQKVNGHYILTEAGDVVPSHDPRKNYADSEGYVMENGQNVNDNNYKDPEVQKIANDIAQNYGGQAVEQMPFLENKAGRVLSGNNRTISGIIAAENNTDQAYLAALAENAQQYGFTQEQLAEYQHPRLQFVVEDELPFTTATFAMFNQQEKKTKSSVNRAIANSKMVTEAVRDKMLEVMDQYDSLDSFFGSENAAADIVQSLISEGLMTQQEVAGLTENTGTGYKFGQSGREYVTDMLLGTLFDEQTIKMLAGEKTLKQAILRALPSIVANRRRKGYELTDSINNAIQLLYEARKANEGKSTADAFQLYLRQVDAFEGSVIDRYNGFDIILANRMSAGVEQLREILGLYNNSAMNEANGQMGFFEPRTIDDIKQDVYEYYTNQQPELAAALNGAAARGAQPESAVPGGVANAGEVRPTQREQLTEYLNGIADEEHPFELFDDASTEELLRSIGASEESIERVKIAVANGAHVNGIKYKGRIYLNADECNTPELARTNYVHERQHLLTTKADLDRVFNAVSYQELNEIVDALAKHSGFYLGRDFNELADEFISFSMEAAYQAENDAELEAVLRQVGANDELVNIIKSINNEQRANENLSKGRRNAVLNDRSASSSPESGRDQTSEPAGVGEQGTGIDQRSLRRTEGGGSDISESGAEQVTPFEKTRLGLVAAEFRRQYPDENVGILFREKDTYEFYDKDAVRAAEILGLQTTEKDGVPFLSFPLEKLQDYLGKLVRGGMKIGIASKPDHKPTKGDYQIGDSLTYNGKTATIQDFTSFGTAILDVEGRRVEVSKEQLDDILDYGDYMYHVGDVVTYNGKRAQIVDFASGDPVIQVEGEGENRYVSFSEIERVKQSAPTENRETSEPERKPKPTRKKAATAEQTQAPVETDAEVIETQKPKNADKIEDVGEKIGGARKDIVQETVDRINVNGDTFAKIFPKFDYHKLIANGLEPRLAAGLKYVCEHAKKSYKIRKKRFGENNALEATRFMANYAKGYLLGDTSLDFTSEGWVFTAYGKRRYEFGIKLWESLREAMGDTMFDVDLSGYDCDVIQSEEERKAEAEEKGRTYRPSSSIYYRRNADGESVEFTPRYAINTPKGDKLFTAEEYDQAVQYFQDQVTSAINYQAANPYELAIYRKRGSDDCCVHAKIGGKWVELTPWGKEYGLKYRDEHRAELQAMAQRKAEELKEQRKNTRPEAKVELRLTRREDGTYGNQFQVKLGKEYVPIKDDIMPITDSYNYLREHRDELAAKAQELLNAYLDEQEANRGWKPQLNIGGLRNRVGTDWRNGADVTAERFRTEFGFRGVEFGNYVTQKERQRLLNECFDALHDMAEILGVSPRALSLNGQLGFAIGARGGAGAKAHYEPGKNVINLTKKNGWGALAHEWWHAMDYYFGKREKERPATSGIFRDDVRKQMQDAFAAVMKAINGSEYLKRSQNLDAKTNKRYYAEDTELGARAFEDYIAKQLIERGQVNDFLSHHTSEEDWNGDISNYPYPIEKDGTALANAFQSFFDTVEEQEDASTGNSVLFSVTDKKYAQFALTQANNPMLDDVHTGIRSVEDIHTLEETLNDERLLVTEPDWEEEDIRRAIEDNQVTIYSSKPIQDGTFVTPSRMTAEDYAGGEMVYEKTVSPDKVAWIASDEGQYADVDHYDGNILFSITNANNEIFYSNAERAVESIKQEKATPEQWRAMIEKAGGLKAGEDKWIGLSDWLAQQRPTIESHPDETPLQFAQRAQAERKKFTISKQDILDYIRRNKIQIEETEYGEASPETSPRFREFQNEVTEMWENVNRMQNGRFNEANQDIIRFEDDMQAKYGDDWRDLMDDSERNVANYLQERRDEINMEVFLPEEVVMEEMCNRHGDDFQLAFSIDDDGSLSIANEDAAGYYLDLDAKPINETRLSYTTEGLTNKHEIAMTVPTIEAWNESDEIHFGDAGEGKVIAWARFGDAYVPADGGKKREQLEAIMADNEQWYKEHHQFAKYGIGDESLHKESEERNNRQRLAYAEAEAVPNTVKVLVIDEIQSKRHQEGREKGYAEVKSSELMRRMEKSEREYRDYLESMRDKYGQMRLPELMTKMSDEDIAEADRLNEAANKARQEWYSTPKDAVPAAPFEKNWHELAMKRILRFAAENGYDKVAWTTGDQQAERYNIGKVVDLIEFSDWIPANEEENDYGVDYRKVVIRPRNQMDMLYYVDRNGNLINQDEGDPKTLAELIGKDLARNIVESSIGNQIGGEGLRIGGEGMRGFYDDILPRFMQKYGKKWGVQVGEVTMPQLEDGYQTMHAIDINDAMRESVMEGQPMFSISGRGVNGTIKPQEGETRSQYIARVAETVKNMTPRNTTIDDAIRFSITVNHNSPYLLKRADGAFVDPETGERLGFDHRFIGSGEGAQAHGWGSYFSQNDIEGYRQETKTYKDEPVAADPYSDNAADRALFYYEQEGGTQKAVKFLRELMREEDDADTKREYQECIDVLLDEKSWGERKGHRYIVEIPDNDGTNYLDEMKTLPKPLRRKIAAAVRELPGEPMPSVKYVNYTGGWRQLGDMIERNQWAYMEIRDRLVEAFGGYPIESEKKLSKMMSSLGFVGVHYDGRRDGECYVIFNPDDAVITDHIRFSVTGGANEQQPIGVSYQNPRGKAPQTPTGNGIQPPVDDFDDQIRSDKFKAWFGDWQNDPEHASKVVDADGKPLVVEHSTPNEFASFDINKLGVNSGDRGIFGAGFYFGDRGNTDIYGKNHMQVYLNMRKPFVMEDYMPDDISAFIVEHFNTPALRKIVLNENGKSITVGDYIDIVNAVNAEMEEGKHDAEIERISSFYRPDSARRKVRDDAIADKSFLIPGSLNYLISTMIGSQEFTNALRENGNDGVIVGKGNGYNEYVVFSPNQIKSATDNNGEFSRDNDDIRFSVTNPSTLSRSETVTKALVQQANNNYNIMQSALKKVTADLKGIRAAMRMQSDYDRKVVDSLLNLYNTLLQENGVWAQYMPDTTRRIATQIVHAIGKQNITEEVNTIMDHMVHAQAKAAQRQWDKLRQTPIDKINISGVVMQGKVALEGQHALKAMNDALQANMTIEQIEEQINQLMDMEDNATDESLKTQYKGQWIGLTIAAQHLERLQHLQEERQQLDLELQSARSNKALKPAARQQLVENIKQAMRDNYIEQAEAYTRSTQDLSEYVNTQEGRAKDFIRRQDANRDKIRSYAQRDLEGLATNPNRNRTRGNVARSIWDAFASPIRDLQSLLRLTGLHAPDGEGYLYNHFMRNWMDGADMERTGIVAASKTLDEKIAELTHGKYKTWEEAARKINDASHNMFGITMLNGVDGKDMPVTEEIPLNAGNALYIYAVNKMNDGRMKLNGMNITEEDVQALADKVREQFGQEILDVVDWVQSEYFSQLRNRYNPTHEALFGAPMDAVENYFPLRINANARQQNEDLSEPDTDAARLLAGTSTGAIKRRTRNSLPLDVRNADFFQEVIRHISQMERWNAFAQWNRDANILFSDINFRNRIKGMKGTIYGEGDKLYNYMKDAFRVAIGTYKPKTDTFSEITLNMAKGVTSAKINFRIFTALKQIASFPAFFTYMQDGVFVGSYLRNWLKPHETMKWAKENLPNFEKRVSKRDMGDMRLMQRSTDWQWNKRILEWSSKYGMFFNVFFDTLTCATGARAVYDSHLADYMKKGYSEEDARNRARQDAEQAFNTSQQSSEGAFMSAVQQDRNLVTAALTVFRTSPIQYTRNFFYHTRNLLRKFGEGKRDEQIAFRMGQYKNDGLNDEQARKAAEKDYNKSLRQDIVGFVVYGALLNILWRLAGQIPYLLLGDDDDKKKQILDDATSGGAWFSPFTGLLGGGIVESALDGNGSVADMFAPEMPFTQDIKRAGQYLSNDKYAEFASQALSVLMQSGTGFDPLTASDMVSRIVTTLDSEEELEAATQALRVSQALLSIPQSQYEQMLIDKVVSGETDEDAALEDYIRYQKIHTAPLTWWMRGEESTEKAEENAERRFNRLLNERDALHNPEEE